MEDKQLKELLDRYQNGEASKEDLAFLESWYAQYNVESPFILSETERQQDVEAAWKKIHTATASPKQIKIWPGLSIAAAAAAAVISIGVWLFDGYRPAPDHTPQQIAQQTEIKPGRNTAKLVLPNGKTIQLSDAKTGVVIDATQLRYSDGTAINTSSQGSSSHQGESNAVLVSTPRGGTYQVILPDGSKVWLNAASSIQFPANFKGHTKRNVKLTGEGYFEIVRNEKQPFTVEGGSQIVEVLGTHFNVNSYADEGATKTTLIEGSVRVSSLQEKAIVIKPGQQAISTNGKTSVIATDTNLETAWINGKFMFNGTSFESAMNMIARWYDIEVIYDYKPTTLSLGGSISRSRSLSDILKRIEQTEEVKFKIEGRRIRVVR